MSTVKEYIGSIINEVALVSSKKIVITEEEKVNKFLDEIIKLRNNFRENNNNLSNLVDKLTALTHYDYTISNEETVLLKDLIAKAFELHRVSLLAWIEFNNNTDLKKCVKSELKEYKNIIDDFKETLHDVECYFFNHQLRDELNRIEKKYA